MSREDIFDKLETLVFDEEMIVTYKLLSREFKIHVNAARQFLLDFLTTQKTKENTSLQATYFLAGLQKKDGVKVCIVSEKSLDDAKKKLKEVTSCHIYSVSKLKPNDVVLFNTDIPYNQKKHDSKELLVIRHPNIEIKPPTLSKINLLKSDAKPAVKSQNTGILKNGVSSNAQKNGKNEKPLKDNSKKVEEIETQKSEVTSANTEIKKPKTETKAQKPNALASLWQKNEEKSKASKNESSKPEGKGKAKSPQENKKTLPKNNIMSMFSKQAEKNIGNSSKKAPISDPIPVKKVEVVSPPKKVEVVSPPKKADLSKSEKKPSKSSTKKRKSSQKQTKTSGKHDSGSDSDECKPAKKKHRRIAVFDDSDSNSDCEDIEAQDKAQRSLYLPEEPMETESPIVPPTPETDEDPIPPTPPVVSHKDRKKISKTVKKTFMDDDGFMVTTEEKEIVSESGSDEDPIPTKSSIKEKTKSNQFTYRKQVSLTNFFKKS